MSNKHSKKYPAFNWRRVDDLIAANIRSLVSFLLPGGKINKKMEYVVRNPLRDDRRTGSFSVHVGSGGKAGVWYDFSMHQGGDFIELWRHVRGGSLTRMDAAKEILDKLGEKN